VISPDDAGLTVQATTASGNTSPSESLTSASYSTTSPWRGAGGPAVIARTSADGGGDDSGTSNDTESIPSAVPSDLAATDTLKVPGCGAELNTTETVTARLEPGFRVGISCGVTCSSDSATAAPAAVVTGVGCS
jgi:hypothetical protein